jgi:antitoxin component of RelBE/YafQ-DinJ toxin-antitoxin module
MAKLTLSVDDRVVSRAKHYAKRQGVSVSQMVEAYLDAVAEPAPANLRDAPILRSLRGVLKKANVEAYKRLLRANL